MKKITTLVLALLLLCACSNTAKDGLSSFKKLSRENTIAYLDRDDFIYRNDGLPLTNDDIKEIEEDKQAIVQSIEKIAKYQNSPIEEKDLTSDDFVIIKNKENKDYLRLYNDGKAVLINEEGRFVIEFIGDDYQTEYNNIIDNLYAIQTLLNQ